MGIILQFYPNGEFSKGVDTSKRKRSRLQRLSDELTRSPAPQRLDHICAEMNAQMEQNECLQGSRYISALGSEFVYLCADMDKHHYAVTNKHGETWVMESEHSPRRLVGLGELTPASIGLSIGLNFTEPKKQRQRRGSMPSAMARKIRNAGFLLEERYGRDNLSFLTLTLPDLDAEDLQRCTDNWGRMVDQFLKWLRDRLALKGIPLEYVYCNEVQLKRLQNRGEYALHVHMLFRGRKNRRSAWGITPKLVRKAWVRCLESVCIGSFQETALENLQRVKYSASAYLGKYLSKGAKSSNSGDICNPGFGFQGHWGGMARSISRAIKQGIVRIAESSGDGYLANGICRHICELTKRGIIKYFREGCIPTNGCKGRVQERGLLVGVGCLAMPTMKGGLVPVLEYVYAHDANLQ